MTLNPSLALYQKKFSLLRTAPNAPHKYCMLLALLDIARAGELNVNAIEYGPTLLDRYADYFAAVAGPSHHPNPYFPFFHLKGNLTDNSASFWILVPMAGREDVLNSLSTARSHKDIVQNIAYARLDEVLFELLKNDQAVDSLAETLASQLTRGQTELSAMMQHINALEGASRYERQLRLQLHKAELVAQEPVVETSLSPVVRDPAFRRVVVQAYDYRCSATGLRVLLPDGAVMVEAAHLVPFSESRNDSPRNGISLTPNMHWALDKNLIAPTPDFTWKVSQQLDGRVPDFQELVGLAGKRLFLPTDKTLWPEREGLEWRVKYLV